MTYSKHRAALATAMMQLRVYEQRWIDLSYPADDPRAAIPDDEQPQYALDERDRLRRGVVMLAALVAGESPEAARLFADAPLAAENPYRIERVRLAASLRWHVDPRALGWARGVLEARTAERRIDAHQTAIEGPLISRAP